MTDQEFNRLCDLHGFGDVASILRESALPCVGISLTDCPTQGAKSSKLGGDAAVPKSFEWPRYKGRPLDLLLQINLREAAKHDLKGFLPPDGLLSFFYELGQQPWGYDPENLSFYKVCYFPEGEELVATPRPDHRLKSPPLVEMGIELWPALSLPTYGSRAWARLAELIEKPDVEFDFSSFDELSQAVFRAAAPTPKGPHHKLGGHSENIQGDMQLEAQLVMNGLYCGDASGYHDPRRRKLEKTCEEWQLLLQFDSDDGANLMWGDAGMLYYWVRGQDLAKRDFSRAWMTLQCG